MQEVERLARLIQFRTVAPRIDEPEIAGAFTGLLDYLEASYPRVFETAQITRENPWRLLIEIPGTERELKPVLFIAHYDVVDVEAATEADWTHPGFSGTVADGYVWGRGALDDKNVLAAMLESVERHLSRGARGAGATPFRRGLILAFGGDEETMGAQGAGELSRRFRDSGRSFYYSIDEGSVIIRGLLKSPARPLAMIGLAEKGYANIRIEAESPGGHASMPPPSTALGTVAQAMRKIEASPFPPRQIATVRAFFRTLGKETPGGIGLIYRHTRLLWPLLRRLLEKRRSTNALLRTTGALTMSRASSVPNVLPQRAEAVVNVRILPGETVESVLQAYRRLLKGLPVTVDLVDPKECHNPSPEAPTAHPAYEAIAHGARELLPEAIVVPFLVPGATDSKWYADLSEGSYRFVPLILTDEDVATIHGTDEKISIEGYLGMIDFYEGLIDSTCVEATERQSGT